MLSKYKKIILRYSSYMLNWYNILFLVYLFHKGIMKINKENTQTSMCYKNRIIFIIFWLVKYFLKYKLIFTGYYDNLYSMDFSVYCMTRSIGLGLILAEKNYNIVIPISYIFCTGYLCIDKPIIK